MHAGMIWSSKTEVWKHKGYFAGNVSLSPFDTIQIRRDLRANLNNEDVSPDEELADPVLALSKDDAEADDVAEDTPEDDPNPEKTWE